MSALSPGEIAEFALSFRDHRSFRDAVAERIRRWIGGDGGWFHTVDPKLPLSGGAWSDLNLDHVERARSGWEGYARELAPLLQQSAQTGFADTTSTFSQTERSKLTFFQDVARPLGIERSLWIGLCHGDHVASIGLARSHGDFRRIPVNQLRDLLPVLTLSDRMFALQELVQVKTPAVQLTILTPRERQVIDTLVLGYTNAEIATALGVSPNTVRNQIATIFRKLGATTRAELVGLYLSPPDDLSPSNLRTSPAFGSFRARLGMPAPPRAYRR